MRLVSDSSFVDMFVVIAAHCPVGLIVSVKEFRILRLISYNIRVS